MSLRHRIIPCIKHHVGNLVEKSSHFRLRNPLYKKMEPFTLTISNRKVVKEHETCPPDCDITPTDECKECEHYTQHTFDKLRLANHIPPVDIKTGYPPSSTKGLSPLRVCICCRHNLRSVTIVVASCVCVRISTMRLLFQ